MINRLSIFFIFTILIIPISLISGPAIPDISISFAVIFFLIIKFYNNNLNDIVKNNIFLISIFFWVYLLLISLFAENIYLSFRDSIIFIRILMIPILIFYIIEHNEKYLEKIIAIIFLAIIFVTIDTLYQYINYESEFGFKNDLLGFVPKWYGRLTGPFKNELIPGAYLSKFSLIGLIFLFINIKKKFYLNFLSIFYLSIIGFTIFASGERMALATFLMGLIILFIFYKNKRLIFLLSIFCIIFLSFISTKIHPFYTDYRIIESSPQHLGLKIEKKFKCNKNKKLICKKIIKMQPEFLKVIKNFDKSAYGEIYSLSLQIYKNNKFFGIGLNNFNYVCLNNTKYKKYISNYSCASHPHNIYIQWLVETGLIGLIFFMIYIMSIFYFILKKNYNNFSIISSVTVLILFWPIMSSGSLLKNWNGISSFYIIGLCLVLSKLNKKIN